MLTSYTIEVKPEGFHVTANYGTFSRYETDCKTFQEGITLLDEWYTEDKEEEKDKIIDQWQVYQREENYVCKNLDTCTLDHNLTGNDDHHYGCSCLPCLRFYLTLKG